MSVKDGLAAIANEVLGDVQKEAEAIILAAENQAKETLREAKKQADQDYQAIMNQATVKAEGERKRIASVTEVEIRNRLLQTKEELVDAAFKKANGELENFVDSQNYRDYLVKLITKVAKNINEKKLVLQINVKDKTWLTPEVLNRLSKKLHRELQLSDREEDFIGGCKIQTLDGKITYDSTIDNQLQEMKSILRVEVARILFGKES